MTPTTHRTENQGRSHAGFSPLSLPGLPIFLALLGFLLLASAAPAASPRIVNGLNSHDYPTTAALLYARSGGAINENNAGAWCSATLIGCQTILTAAHCVEDDSNPSHYAVFLQHAGLFSVASITSHTSYSFPIADVAVIKLASPVTGIDPTPVNTTNPAPFVPGHPGIIVGYGQTSDYGNDYAIKRWGKVVTANCTRQSGGTNAELICWDYQNPVGPAGDDSSTCNGDSGGPLFMDFGSGQAVAGITSGGTVGCVPGDHSYDVNVYNYRNFVLNELGMDSVTACGGLPPVGGGGLVQVIGNSGTLNASNTSDSYTVNVGNNVNAVRFTLNGQDNDAFDVNFYVKQGTGASPSSFDCKSDGGSIFGACEVLNPTAGTWSIYVERATDAGEYQVTTTIFGGNPPVCGNDIAEIGEECDGTDDSACGGLCQSDCTCPAPVCGNDIIESGEQCDGTDPGSCATGTCGQNCACPAPVCGNDIVETGEQCDGASDTACSGQCQTDCTCPAQCTADELFVNRARIDARRFKVTAELDNFSGNYDTIDPRKGFTLVASEGGSSVTVTIPANDPGWSRSRPDKGKYRWKGNVNGITRVRLLQKQRGIYWKLIVKGKNVPGAGAIDMWAPVDFHLEVDGTCTDTVW